MYIVHLCAIASVELARLFNKTVELERSHFDGRWSRCHRSRTTPVLSQPLPYTAHLTSRHYLPIQPLQHCRSHSRRTIVAVTVGRAILTTVTVVLVAVFVAVLSVVVFVAVLTVRFVSITTSPPTRLPTQPPTPASPPPTSQLPPVLLAASEVSVVVRQLVSDGAVEYECVDGHTLLSGLFDECCFRLLFCFSFRLSRHFLPYIELTLVRVSFA